MPIAHFPLVIGQVKTDEKSNEITAIPQLLEFLAISGCIITIDAAGCQKTIVAEIVSKGADYKSGQWSMRNGQWSMRNGQWSVIYRLNIDH